VKAQQDYAQKTYLGSIQQQLSGQGIDLSKRSDLVKDALFSTAVQHGENGGGANVVSAALKGMDLGKATDKDVVDAIYKERGRKDESGKLVHFKSSVPKVQASVANRFGNEGAKGQSMVDQEFDARVKEVLGDQPLPMGFAKASDVLTQPPEVRKQFIDQVQQIASANAQSQNNTLGSSMPKATTVAMTRKDTMPDIDTPMSKMTESLKPGKSVGRGGRQVVKLGSGDGGAKQKEIDGDSIPMVLNGGGLQLLNNGMA
jgi:hypothetical protein